MKAKFRAHQRFPEYSSLSSGISIGALALGTVIGRVIGLEPMEDTRPVVEAGPAGHHRAERSDDRQDDAQQSIDEGSDSEHDPSP